MQYTVLEIKVWARQRSLQRLWGRICSRPLILASGVASNPWCFLTCKHITQIHLCHHMSCFTHVYFCIHLCVSSPLLVRIPVSTNRSLLQMRGRRRQRGGAAGCAVECGVWGRAGRPGEWTTAEQGSQTLAWERPDPCESSCDTGCWWPDAVVLGGARDGVFLTSSRGCWCCRLRKPVLSRETSTRNWPSRGAGKRQDRRKRLNPWKGCSGD